MINRLQMFNKLTSLHFLCHSVNAVPKSTALCFLFHPHKLNSLLRVHKDTFKINYFFLLTARFLLYYN